jgi:hypothetical protein
MSRARLNTHKGATKNIYNGSKEGWRMHNEDIESLGEILLY